MRFRSRFRKCTSRMRGILTMHEPDSTIDYLRERNTLLSCALTHSDKAQASIRSKHMIRSYVWMKLLTSVLFTAVTSFAQSSDRLPVTDAEKIADALRGGPAFITKDATVRDWPSAPGGEYRLLRKGSNEWPCLPAMPGIRTMSQGASTQYSCAGCRTALPDERRRSITSAS